MSDPSETPPASPEPESGSVSKRLRSAADYFSKVWDALTLIGELEQSQRKLADALKVQGDALRDLRKDTELLSERLDASARESARTEAREVTRDLRDEYGALRERLALLEAQMKRLDK